VPDDALPDVCGDPSMTAIVLDDGVEDAGTPLDPANQNDADDPLSQAA
jgi:hypothetical protein